MSDAEDRGGRPAIPRTLDAALTPDWLTAALGTRYPGIEVTGVTPGRVISRVATNARFRIECAGGLPEGLSPDLCLKGYFTDIGWDFRHAGIPEASFYREVAVPLGLHTLNSVYADLDPETMASAVITEDVVTQGATFLDALSDYTPDQVAQTLGDLAELHAATWEDQRWAAAGWLTPRFGMYTKNRGVADIRVNFDGPIGADVPDEVRDAQRLYDTYAELALEAEQESPWCVIHGDSHVGNVFVDAAGRPTFVDWQLVQRGPWYLDVGYHMSSALTIEDRRANERDLVTHYLDRLAAGGVEVPSADDVWRGIRRGIVHGFYLWGITLKVDPAITSRLLLRLGTAAADHDAYAAVTSRQESRP